jgi:hypothetical protein
MLSAVRRGKQGPPSHHYMYCELHNDRPVSD